MTPKRILIFSTAYYPFVGGAEIAIKEITDRLMGDFEFDLITARFKKELPSVEKVGNVTVYRMGTGKPLCDKVLLPFRGALKAWQLEKEHTYFCLWGMMATFASGAGYVLNIVRACSGKSHIPMVLTLQEGDSDAHLRYRWGGMLSLSLWLALRNTDFLTALSNFLLHRAERFGYKGRSALVPNGVDIGVFSQVVTQSEKEKIKVLLDKKDGEVFLVTTSRLVHKNAVDDIISALPCVSTFVSLVVIGTGEEGLRLQELAGSLGVADRVKFLGFLPHKDIPKYFSVCDIFVRPSRSEGFGNSFIEAMAAGLPVIATPVGGIVDFIDDKETGLFCSPDNPKSLAGAVCTLIEDRLLVSKISYQGRARVLARYSWETIAEEMKEKVFGTLIFPACR